MKKILSRFRLGLPVALLVVAVLLLPDCAWAADAKGSDTLKSLAELAGVVIEILTFLALLMLKFFGELLGTDMITGTEAMEAIRPMWVWVRNLTNILFVGVLLFLAFSNLFASFTGDGGNWTIKEKLPKLIIAMIAINFSLLGFKVVIDAVNVGTIAILGIADHRLEPGIKDLAKSMGGTRSWIKVDADRYQILIDNKIGEEAESPTTEESGQDCEVQWLSHFGNGNADCVGNVERCILSATDKEGKQLVCRGFTEQINDLFCRNWAGWTKNEREGEAKGDGTCVFMMEPEKFESILEPSSEPGQNLFAAFGSTFMHLEKLPALGAQINNLGAVVTNTLFSAILALAFIVALIAVFIAMVARLIVLWITLVFSPLLVGAAILGVDGGAGGKVTTIIVTHLVMPLKVAAAFAVGFVMMSAMVEWNGGTTESTFFFGPALSQLGGNEYAFLWQIATIVLFWMAAFWALEGSLVEDYIIKPIKQGAEVLASAAAKTATIDRPMFSVGTGENKKEFSMGAMLKMPDAVRMQQQKDQRQNFTEMQSALGFTEAPEIGKIKKAKLDGTGKELRGLFENLGSAAVVLRNKKLIGDKMVEGNFSKDQVASFTAAKSHEDINNLLGSMRQERFASTNYASGKTEASVTPSAPATAQDLSKGTYANDSELKKAQGKLSSENKKEVATTVASTVKVVDKHGNVVNFSELGVGKETAVASLNDKTHQNFNIKNIYNNSDEKMKKEILDKLNDGRDIKKRLRMGTDGFEEYDATPST